MFNVYENNDLKVILSEMDILYHKLRPTTEIEKQVVSILRKACLDLQNTGTIEQISPMKAAILNQWRFNLLKDLDLRCLFVDITDPLTSLVEDVKEYLDTEESECIDEEEKTEMLAQTKNRIKLSIKQLDEITEGDSWHFLQRDIRHAFEAME